VSGVAATELLPALVHALAPLESELVEADMRGLVAAALARAPRRSLVVLFTGLDAAAVEEGLLPGLPALTRRHRVLVASVADPAVAAIAAGRGDSPPCTRRPPPSGPPPSAGAPPRCWAASG